MTILRKSISLLALFSIVPAAWAVTMRPSAISTTTGALTATAVNGASRRLPVSTGYRLLSGNVVGAATTSSSSSVASLDDVECVEEYTSCITGDDACGSDFEECTTNVLFHAQMTDCTSTLMQCTPNGIANLFGINNINNLSAAASTDEDGRITEFVYPTADSVMGQKIIAAEIDNRYSTEQCARNYTRCLEKDDVCGANFELCTNAKEFKRQALYCDSKLARCQVEGVKHMFGTAKRYATVDDLKESEVKSGVIHDRIAAGADYVANNALDTCYKVVDNCFAKACTANPFRCLEGTSVGKLKSAQMVSDGGNSGEIELNNLYGGDETAKLNGSQINRYLRTSCADTIGLNESCQMIVNGKKATAKQLKDQDEKEDIIDTVYASMYNDRLSRIQSIVQGLAQEFDSSAKTECIETIQECAIRSCGGGSGSACYTKVMSGKGENKSIAVGEAYEDIKTGCTAVVNTNPYCLYAKSAAGESDSTVYSYSFTADDAFSTLFPDHSNGTNAGDPIGAVATINAALFSTYNESGLARMKNECAAAARGCVKALCGKDYEACYRNRTDAYSNITQTGMVSYDNSMNKVSGVLDYTIILGLCVDTVKNNESCAEHLAIEKINIAKDAENTTSQWGNADTARSGWYAAGAGANADGKIQAVDENGNKMCLTDAGKAGVCYTANDNGEIYNKPQMISFNAYNDTVATNTLFKELVYDLEKEAQGIYNAKLTKLQNMCISSNNGGLMGADDMYSTYKWVKLVKNKVPDNYASTGLQASDFRASNDLYGSFCAVQVTLYSEDQTIRDALNGALKEKNEKAVEGKYTDGDTVSLSNSRYFAVGDPIVCGGWLTGAELEKIASVVEAKAREQKKDEQPKNLRAWMSALGAVGLGTGGMFLGDAIEKGTVGSSFTGISNTKKSATVDSNIKECKKYLNDAKTKVKSSVKKSEDIEELKDAIEKSIDNANAVLRKSGIADSDVIDIDLDDWETALDNYCKADTNGKCKNDDAKKNEAKTEAKDLKTAIDDAINDHCVEAINAKCAGDQTYDVSKKTCVEDKQATAWKGKVSGAIVGAVGGGVLGYTITDAVLDAQLDQAGNEAYKAFMEAVGSKIHCRIGSENVGSYGQIIETSVK